MLTESGSTGLVINATDASLADYCGTTTAEIVEWKREAESAGLLTSAAGSIHINSRMEFLEI